MGEQNGGQRGTLQIEGMGTTETRQMEAVYAALFVAGTVIPLSRFLPWLADHGIDVSLFFDELFRQQDQLLLRLGRHPRGGDAAGTGGGRP